MTTAGTVEQAVERATADVPDVLLLDLTLPDGSGLDVLERLRERARLPRVCVALTGHDDQQLGAQCRAAGCRDVLLKPVPVRVLLAKLGEWLRAEEGT